MNLFQKFCALFGAEYAVIFVKDNNSWHVQTKATVRKVRKLASFFLDGAGNVRRCANHCGNWVEFDAVHTLFEPQSVDAALAAQAKQGGV